MPLKGRPPFPPDTFVFALEGGASDVPGVGPFAWKKGTRFKGDHPAVLLNPRFFVAEGADDTEISERRRPFVRGADRTPPAPPRTQVLERVKDEDAAIAIHQFAADGSYVAWGDRLPKNDPIVKQNRRDFVDVMPPGVSRADCLLAVATCSHEANGVVSTVYAGQLVPRDSWAPVLHPTLFLPPDPEED